MHCQTPLVNYWDLPLSTLLAEWADGGYAQVWRMDGAAVAVYLGPAKFILFLFEQSPQIISFAVFNQTREHLCLLAKGMAQFC